jgi:dTDP-4-dehydrorhamnose reductase
MKALITGAGGQLAVELADQVPAGVSVIPLTREALDIGDAAAVRVALSRHAPDVVINAAAYTAVDKAESERDLAFRVNADGAAYLCAAARGIGARFVHVSTDFVFDGRAHRAYLPEDPTGPLGVYGASKLAGEEAVMREDPAALIVRTAWVYSPWGANFLKTMLRLMAQRGEVRVVADQIGAPTSATTLAQTIWALVGAGATGMHHCTDAGVASWYDFAQAIAEEAQARRMLGPGVRVCPIATSDYPTPAARPAFSVLDKTSTWSMLGGPAPHWRVSLRKVLVRLEALT